MRSQFLPTKSNHDEQAATNLKEAREACPWATAITKVDGGYMAFESVDDLHVFEAQE